MAELLKTDHSGSNEYYTCPLKYWLTKEGWKPENGGTALRFGSVFHAGMEGYYSAIMEFGWSRDGRAVERMIQFASEEWNKQTDEQQFYDDYRTLELCIQLMTRYIDHFFGDHGFLEVIHTERAFQLTMIPTDVDLSHYPWLESFYFTGKIDLECLLNGMHWTNEFKTTGWRIDQLIKELARSTQIMGYAYAKNHVFDEVPEGCLITVAFAKANKLKAGGYGKPRIDFARVPQIYNNVDLQQWRTHFMNIAAQIQYSIKTDHFPPRLQNCYAYGRCQFLNLCEQSCDIKDAHYRGYVQSEPWDVTKEVAPNELIKGVES